MTTEQSTVQIENGELHALRSASLPHDAVPHRVLLAPWGRVESTNGVFVVDEESVELAQSAFETHGTDLPIDFEHQTLGGEYASPSGQAPAAGWIKRIVAREGEGLFADIEWTQEAATLLTSKKYRYLSPVAIVRKADRKLIAIHSAALTNKPAIVGMEPIVNRDRPEPGAESESLAILRVDLDLSADADAQTILLAAGERIRQLNTQAKSRHVEGRVLEAMRSGKLVEAQRAWAEALVAREEELFDEWFRSAPVVVIPGALAAPSGPEAAYRRGSLENRSRAEFRANSMLGQLTSEQAYVRDALRRVAG